MNDMPDRPDRLFKDVIAAHEAEVQFNRDRSRAGWWVGGIGAAIGVLGIAGATVMAIYHVPVVRYTEIDDASGVIRQSFGAVDAPAHFNDRVLRHYISEYVEMRERYVWQLDPQTFHRVTLMSAPAEQTRYAAEREKDSPARKYGTEGYSRVVRFIAFTKRAQGTDKTLEYDVQFVKGEVLAGNPAQPHETRMTARLAFQMHPELPMNEQDRLDNEAGMMVISYNASAD